MNWASSGCDSPNPQSLTDIMRDVKQLIVPAVPPSIRKKASAPPLAAPALSRLLLPRLQLPEHPRRDPRLRPRRHWIHMGLPTPIQGSERVSSADRAGDAHGQLAGPDAGSSREIPLPRKHREQPRRRARPLSCDSNIPQETQDSASDTEFCALAAAARSKIDELVPTLRKRYPRKSLYELQGLARGRLVAYASIEVVPASERRQAHSCFEKACRIHMIRCRTLRTAAADGYALRGSLLRVEIEKVSGDRLLIGRT